MPTLPKPIGRDTPRGANQVTKVDAGQMSSALSSFGASQQALARQLVESGEALGSRADDRIRSEAEEQKRKDIYEEARAKSHMRRSILFAQDALDENADYEKYEESYTKTVDKAYSDASKIIGNPSTRQLFEIEARDMHDAGLVKVRGKARKRERDTGLATTEEILEKNSELYLSSVSRGDEATAASIMDDSSALIDAAAGKNYYTKAQARKRRHDFVSGALGDRVFMMDDSDKVRVFKPDTEVTPQEFIGPQAEKAGLEADYLIKVASIESKFDPNAINPASGAKGLFQFMPETAKHFDLENPMDAKESVTAMIKLTKTNKSQLKKALKREPTNAELYLAHQQGASGAVALLSNPDELAVAALSDVYGSKETAEKAIVNNGGTVNMTAGEFANQWLARYEDEPVAGKDMKIPYYEPTGTWIDMVPARKRREAYDGAVLNIGKAAENEKRKRLADMSVAEDDLFQRGIAGTLTYKDVVDYKEEAKGDTEAQEFSVLLQDMLSPEQESIYEQTEEIKKNIVFNGLTEKMISLNFLSGGDANKAGEIKLNSETLEEYRKFKVEVYSHINKEITLPQAQAFTKSIDKSILDAVANDRTSGGSIALGIQNPHAEGLKLIDTYLKNKGRENDLALKKKLFMEFDMSLGSFNDKGEYTASGEYESTGSGSKDKAVIRKALKLAAENINKDNYAGIFDPDKMPDASVGVVPTPPKAGDVVDGYKFKGGKPFDPKNWKKVK